MAVAGGLLHYKFNLGMWVKEFNVDLCSGNFFNPCIKHYLKITGNGIAINHTNKLFP
jgi:hypothetical protein